MNKFFISAMLLVILAGCEQSPEEPTTSVAAEFSLPEAVSNNAVAVADGPDGPTLYSFNGLQPDKSWRGTSNAAFACVISIKACEKLPPVPVSEGRLASAATTVADKIYIFGGYTVSEEGDEVSTPEVFAFDPQTQSYERLADIPTPVDDTVVLPYKDRYIYLISGWRDEGNVSVVQLYDTQFDTWSTATEYPGKPVFGHSGGISKNTMIITDGVAVAGVVDGKRKFAAAPFTWRGDIDPGDPARITWTAIEQHPGAPRYRMAATGDSSGNMVIFAGGGNNPYNYDGIGYDGKPAMPTGRVFGYDLKVGQWTELATLAEASMDHRGLVKSGDYYYILGGMDKNQAVTDRIMKFRIND